ncbi:GIY-YIG nuclease family protein [Streptomyces lateritius]|uniref:GIY-YIG nuclease family protein n=1 Tax=Streptomyces lateritius TaxID=67313 RepID=UPI0016775999|nr:GIY-YIG nuclease family protein [Streptomyces lateritius]GGU11399.1 hypothetical protein GCM10010272_65780 [Streptomyces lateritius]
MTTYVYVIGEQGSSIVKIGTTNDLSLRLTALQTGNPNPLVLLWSHQGNRELEGHLHATFAAYRVRGEWFDLTALGDPAEVVQCAATSAGRELLPAPRRAPGTARRERGLTQRTPDMTKIQASLRRSYVLEERFGTRKHFTIQQAAEALEEPLDIVEAYVWKRVAMRELVHRRDLGRGGKEPLFTIPGIDDCEVNYYMLGPRSRPAGS